MSTPWVRLQIVVLGDPAYNARPQTGVIISFGPQNTALLLLSLLYLEEIGKKHCISEINFFDFFNFSY